MGILIGSNVVSTTAGLLIVPPPEPVPWTPDQLGSALRGWWVPHSLALAPGDPVASLPSSGGVSNTLSQATAGSRPAYGSSFNGTGKGFITFDGVDDHMSMSDLSVSNAAPALVMWMLYQHISVLTDAQLKFMMTVRAAGNTSPRLAMHLSNAVGASKPIGLSYRATDGSATVSRYSGVAADTSPHLLILQMIFGGAGAPKIDIWRDGTNILNETPGFSAANLSAGDASNAYVGASGTVANTGVNMSMAQGGIIRGSITLADRQKLEGYLAHYGGIAANLPGDHPYKSAAPVI